MTDSDKFDIAIIGAGPGGYSVALRAAQLGKTVALIDTNPVPGGVCLHEGCVPSKALLTAAHLINDSKRSEEMGLDLVLEYIDIDRLMEYKDGIVDQMTTGLAGLLRKRKVTTITGRASMVDAHELVVETPEGRTLQIEASDIVLSPGSRPRHLMGIDFEGPFLSSRQALNLHQIPESVTIIGSGAIGLEFATLWNALGTQVTVLEVADRILPAATPRISATVSRNLKKAGISFSTGITIDTLTANNDETASVTFRNSADDNPDDAENVTSQFVLIAIGRVPNTTDPWYEKLGIQKNDRGYVITDAYGRTSVEGVWALGDITMGKQLAHRAFAQGITVAESIAGIETTPVDDHNVPAVTFALTEVGFVGYSAYEAEDDENFSEVKETTLPMMGNARVAMSGQSGSITVVSGITHDKPDVRVILGVQMAGPGVSELAAEAEQLVGNRVPLHEASQLIHPHPTLSETLGEALLSADGRPLHSR